jgi:hypothetical protein
MWYKLNESIGIILLIAIVGGGSVYGLYKLVSGPPLLRQEGDEVDPRTNPYARQMMAEHDRAMQKVQRQIQQNIDEAMEVGNRVRGL